MRRLWRNPGDDLGLEQPSVNITDLKAFRPKPRAVVHRNPLSVATFTFLTNKGVASPLQAQFLLFP